MWHFQTTDTSRKRKREAGKIPRNKGGNGKDVEVEGNSGASKWSTGSYDLQAGRVAPADPGRNVRDLCPEERRPRNIKNTAGSKTAGRGPEVEQGNVVGRITMTTLSINIQPFSW